MSDSRTLTQRIGQTENALRAMLDRLLAEAELTFVQWVALTMMARGGTDVQPESLARQISGALKCDIPTSLAALNALTSRGLLITPSDDSTHIRLMTHGDTQFQQLRQRIESITERLYSDIPTDDLATTHRVLSIITERVNAELEQQS